MGYRALTSGWLILAAMGAACGRYGFADQSATRIDGGPGDGPVGGGDGPIGGGDGPIGGDAPGVDAAVACGWIDCGANHVTCCDTSTPACVPVATPCQSSRRFECDQLTGAGCTVPGEQCCITIDAMGTECVDPLTEPCYG